MHFNDNLIFFMKTYFQGTFFTNIFQEKTETTSLSYVSNDNAITDIVRQNIFYNNVSKRNKDLFLFKETVY